jgi:hypothetical protein
MNEKQREAMSLIEEALDNLVESGNTSNAQQHRCIDEATKQLFKARDLLAESFVEERT